jgi:predicted GNAT family acetyltransferase
VPSCLSQKLLDSGRRFCFLFTDLANPTSNHVYQAVGYEPVGDADEYRFGAAPAAEA